MRTRVVLAGFLGLALFAGISAVYAQSINECQALITALGVRTQTVTIIGRNAEKDREGLLGKLSDAAFKLDAAKFCDAIQKLADFKAKVQQLSGAGKIGADDAALLSGDADVAIGCVQNVATGAGVSCGG